MKRKPTFLAMALLILTVIAITAFRPYEIQVQKIDISGTWRLDTYRYGDNGSFIPVGESNPHIKLITGNSFMWAIYDPASKKISESAGGRYTLEGDNYTEFIDYGYNMDTYVGTVGKFKINAGEGMFLMTGYLKDGYKVEEVWRKIE